MFKSELIKLLSEIADEDSLGNPAEVNLLFGVSNGGYRKINRVRVFFNIIGKKVIVLEEEEE